MYTDLHCHLLYGIDDGAKTAEESLAMARTLVALGFSAVATSPHARPQYPDADRVAERRAEVKALLDGNGVPLVLHEGAENFLDGEFLERELSGRGRHIASTSYVLVELPFEAAVPALPDLLFRLRRKGVRPLIAHPERCVEFERSGRAEEAVRTGAALQLDVGSLTGRYGKMAKKVSRRLLDAGLYAVGATDLHGPVGAEKWVGEAMRAVRSAVGESGEKRLLGENPARILRGEDLLE
jgi:protein-tyrosine phosphatase